MVIFLFKSNVVLSQDDAKLRQISREIKGLEQSLNAIIHKNHKLGQEIIKKLFRNMWTNFKILH